jgi:hypothetical protein
MIEKKGHESHSINNHQSPIDNSIAILPSCRLSHSLFPFDLLIIYFDFQENFAKPFAIFCDYKVQARSKE